ncbi:MAG: ABC transporter [Epulopiscium sp. Nele67-Bin004]|nr:MAG: ABC transporter [Epulopiscium sp. Nele67-Bin004]
MNNFIEVFISYFSYPFVRYAFIVGVLIALSASLLGATLVLKRFSYIGDSLSHIAFGAIAIATIFNISSEMIFTLPATAACAVLLLRIGTDSKINTDAVIAMFSVGALAIGYLLMNLFPSSANISADVCTTLFGATSILTLTKLDVYLSAFLCIVVISIFIIFYNKIFAITFDENFARATGINTKFYNLILSIVIALVIVVAMNLVGSLLISALIIFPAISSMRLFKDFKSVIISSAIISVVCAFSGMVISIFKSTPIGSTIVAINIFVLGLFFLISKILYGRVQ